MKKANPSTWMRKPEPDHRGTKMMEILRDNMAKLMQLTQASQVHPECWLKHRLLPHLVQEFLLPWVCGTIQGSAFLSATRWCDAADPGAAL